MAKTTFTVAESKDERTQARAALDHHHKLAADAAVDLYSELVEEYLEIARARKARKPTNKQRKIMFDRDVERLAEYHAQPVDQMLKNLADTAREYLENPIGREYKKRSATEGK